MCAVIDEYRRFTGTLTPKRLEYRSQLAEWAVMARAAYRDQRWDRLVAETAAIKFGL